MNFSAYILLNLRKTVRLDPLTTPRARDMANRFRTQGKIR